MAVEIRYLAHSAVELKSGDTTVLDRYDAVTAVELIRPSVVIPIHYNTFPPIETDAEAFKADVESQTSAKVVVLAPGEIHSS